MEISDKCPSQLYIRRTSPWCFPHTQVSQETYHLDSKSVYFKRDQPEQQMNQKYTSAWKLYKGQAASKFFVLIVATTLHFIQHSEILVTLVHSVQSRLTGTLGSYQ